MNRHFSIVATLLAVLFAALGCATPSSQGDPKWVTLIDGGTGLDNWIRVGDANWRAVDGAIQADMKTDKANSFLVTKNSYTDFRIRAEFWASDDANSGIYMRCADIKNLTDRTCYEANIFDQRPDPTLWHRIHRSSFPGIADAEGWRQMEHVRRHGQGNALGSDAERGRHRRYSGQQARQRPDCTAIRGRGGQVPQGADRASLVEPIEATPAGVARFTPGWLARHRGNRARVVPDFVSAAIAL